MDSVPGRSAGTGIEDSPATAATASARPAQGAARVLVVEDNPVNREVVCDMLRHLGAMTTVAENGQLAVEAVRKNRFDVVLMDCQMPIMDGFAATRMIRAEESDRRLPIVALTANAFAEDRKRCMDAGMDDFIAKPATIEMLNMVLARYAGGTAPGTAASIAPPAPAAENRREPLDHAALDALRALQGPDQPSLLGQLITLYLEDTPRLMVALREALDQADAAGAYDAAHQLKSSSTNLGARSLAASAARLEALVQAGALPDAAALWANLQEEYQRASSALQALLSAES